MPIRRQPAAQAGRADSSRLAALERVLFDTTPPSGSPEAMAMMLGAGSLCMPHDPLADVSEVPVQAARCSRCGRAMRMGATGSWEVPPASANPVTPSIATEAEYLLRPLMKPSFTGTGITLEAGEYLLRPPGRAAVGAAVVTPRAPLHFGPEMGFWAAAKKRQRSEDRKLFLSALVIPVCLLLLQLYLASK